MTKLVAIAIASALSVWLISTAAWATTCEAKLTPLQTGGTLIQGMSDARGGVFAVIRGSDGRFLQQLDLMNDPVAQMEGKIEPRPRYGSFVAVALFEIDPKESYSVSITDLKKRVLCVTYTQLKPVVSVLDARISVTSSSRPRVAAVEEVEVVEHDEIVAAADEAE